MGQPIRVGTRPQRTRLVSHKLRSRAALLVALEQATALGDLSLEALRIIKSLNEAIKDVEV